MRMLDGRMAACAWPRACSQDNADTRQCGQVINVWRRSSLARRLKVGGSSARKLFRVRSVSAPVKSAHTVSSTKYEAYMETRCRCANFRSFLTSASTSSEEKK